MEDILLCDCPICLNSWTLAKSGWIVCWLDHRTIIFLFLSSFYSLLALFIMQPFKFITKYIGLQFLGFLFFKADIETADKLGPSD